MTPTSKQMQGMAPTDEHLVETFQSGDSSAFDVLAQRWERKIQGAIHRVVPEEDARDLWQETLLKAYRGLGTFKREARFSSWLYQIALNVCRDRLRRRRGRAHLSLEELDEAGETLPATAAPSALDLVEARDLRRRVASAVAALPEEQREVIVLKEYEELTFLEIAGKHGPFDLIFEASGFAPLVFDAMQALAKNGVLVLTSITGGHHMLEVPADRINLDFVLGNKVMVGSVNASRDNFETGVRDMSQAEAEYPGWLRQLLTHPVRGLDQYRELFDRLQKPDGAIKIFCEVS